MEGLIKLWTAAERRVVTAAVNTINNGFLDLCTCIKYTLLTDSFINNLQYKCTHITV